MKENNSTSYLKMIDDVIENGVKEVVSYDEHKRGPVNTFGYIDDIIKEGEKINGTYAGGQRQSEKCKSVVEYGIKETINWSDSIDNCIDKVINEGTKNPTD
jgi:methylmalonyl-CoA mutase cobalamin-binding subunit